MTVTVRNKVWTSHDFRALKSALRNSRNIEYAAKRLDRPVREVEEVARDLGWLDAPPLAPQD